MISIHDGDAHDVPSIMPVMETAFDPSFGEAWNAAQCLSALSMPGCRLLVARTNDGSVAGFAMSRWVLHTEELLMIGIMPSWQRRAIGSQLLESMIARAQDAGREKLFLEVRDGNDAIDFYLAHGFAAIGTRKNYYHGRDGETADAITMARNL